MARGGLPCPSGNKPAMQELEGCMDKHLIRQQSLGELLNLDGLSGQLWARSTTDLVLTSFLCGSFFGGGNKISIEH